MRYPVAIETGSADRAYGVVAPDLPGSFSARDTFDEATTNAKEAVAAWVDAARDEGEAIPRCSSFEALRADKRFSGWSFGEAHSGA